MSSRAWAYVIGTITVAGVLSILVLSAPFPSESDWVTFLTLAIFATVSQLGKALFSTRSEADRASTSYSPAYIFFSAGFLLLPPALFVLLCITPHLIEWLKERYQHSTNLPAWYIQPFNIATHILCGLVAQRAYGALIPLIPFTQVPPQLLAGLVAVLIYVALNHLLVGLALVLARRLTWKQTGVLEFENLMPDCIMMSLGYAVALLWAINPWLILPALSPLLLIQRALMVPQLKHEARLDGKTGLWNARYFGELFKAEFQRSKRFDRPLAVIMSDLDLLRNINNTYGHLAGDAVLEQIGDIIRKTTREYDIAARFGGEEFAIAMPETSPAEAVVLAERLRQAVESTEFHAKTTPTPIRVTISIGTACFPTDAMTPNDLIHAADVAVYQAKLQGRNRVVSSSSLPRSITIESANARDRVEPPPTYEFSPRPELESEIDKGTTPAIHSNANAETLALDKDTTPGAPQAGQDLQPANSLQETETLSPASRDESERKGGKASRVHRPPMLLYSFLALVIGFGALVSMSAFSLDSHHDMLVIGLLTGLAIVGELFQIDVLENTISVSVAVNFAAALITGPVGLVFTSGAIAFTHRLRQPVSGGVALYKTAFNWSTHVLSGLAPILVIKVLNLSPDLSNLPVLFLAIGLASLLYFIIESGLLAMAIGLSSRGQVITIWKDNFSWVTGHYIVLCIMGTIMALGYHALDLVGLIAFALPLLMMRYAQSQYVERTRESMQELKRMNQELGRANEQIILASRSMRQLNDELFLTLAKIIDARDPYVCGHAAKVSEYATAIATELGLPAERVEQVRQAGFLHDIGKIGIPEHILHKPERLSQTEYGLMKTHVVLGGEFVETCHGLRHLATFVRHHHEWWNGRGYPDRLRAEQIPLEARILAVCDAVEAMASDRPYHAAMPLPEILAEISRCAGTQFDPAVVDTFIQVAEREGTRLVTNSAREVNLRSGHRGNSEGGAAERLSPQDLEFIVLPESIRRQFLH